MLNPRPVGYVIGLLVLSLGLSMIVPALVDIAHNSTNWRAFALAGAISVFFGGAVAMACAENRGPGLSIQQAFILTTLSWLALPVFGALPFTLGAPSVSYTDAFFEAMSGLTTTGSTVFTGLQYMPKGVLLWRGMLQWFGGVGIVVFAMAFLPMLKVGGMQLFKSEAFDTFGKILPRAAEIAMSIGWVYLGLTAIAAIAYAVSGMETLDALTHAMTTVSTGGFANHDDSFGAYEGAAEYIAAVFMILAALPFVRFVQIVNGSAKPLFVDPQVRTFLVICVIVILALSLYQAVEQGEISEEIMRQSLFNSVSILTGTGYASTDYTAWGAFATMMFFLIGLIGGCAGSTSCSIKIFRFQVLYGAVVTQLKLLHSPNGVFSLRYGGKPVEDDVISSVMSFLFFFFLTFGLCAVTLSMMGLAPITAISGAATAVANIGPGLGPEIGPSGNFAGLPDMAKWVLAFTMLLGRLELLSVLVLLTPKFWRG